MQFTRLALFLPLTVIAALSQVPQSAVPAADPIIRVSVNLVQVDVVVTDSKGHHIPGLGPDDFDVLEDGKPQKITHLSYIDATPAKPAVPVTVPKSPASKGPPEIIHAASRKPRPGEIHRAMVFLVDDIHTSPEDLIQLKPVARKFVAEQVAPGDLVSIAAVRGGMGFYEQFTSDRAILDAAVESLSKRVGGSSEEVDPADGAAGCLRELMLFETVMGKLSWSIQSLNQLPGRKAIVFFTDGLAIPRQACPSESQSMTDTMQKVAQQSTRSGVAIYAIDSRGLVTNQLTAADRVTGGARGVVAALNARSAHSLALQETSDFLAAETGGIFFRNTNGLSDALGASINDMSGYYLIGFQPARTDFELKNGATVFHKVEVKLHRKGYAIRYGKGFLGTPDKDTAAPLTREQELANALISPFDSGDIKVRLTALYSAPVPGPNGERRPTALKALLAIDGSNLRLTDTPDGRKKATLDIVAAAYRSDNTPIYNSSHEYSMSVKPEDVSKLEKGVVYQTVVELPRSGAYQIRVAVRDATSGLLGSANSIVVVPDFNRPHISLSSLALTGAGGGDMLAEAAAREFHPGSEVLYPCEVFGTKADAEIEIRLFHEGIRVFASQPRTVAKTDGAKSIAVSGKLSLPAGLAEGDYQVELVARDPLVPAKQQLTSQWSDLTLMR